MTSSNTGNARIIAALYGDDTDGWIGQKITLYAAQVSAFGQIQPAIRVRDKVGAK